MIRSLPLLAIAVMLSALPHVSIANICKPDTAAIDSNAGTAQAVLRPIHITSVEAGTVATSDHVPFWMRANQFGNRPISGFSTFVIAKSGKAYSKVSKLDWGYGLEGRINAGNRLNTILTEAYAKGRIGYLELRAGRSRQISGLVDSTLSVGAFAVSGNALGIPKIELSIPEFFPVKFLGNFVAFKGNFAHGWLGTATINQIRQKLSPAKTYFHQKSFYVRLGGEHSWLKLYGGFNHQVFWGNERIVYGKTFTLSTLESYRYVVTGKTMKAAMNGFEQGKIGNHLGSIDFGGELLFDRVRFFGYRQNFYDVGALAKLANIKDGLNGFRVENRVAGTNHVYWKKILVEFLYTKSQAGEANAKFTKSGDENYYNGFYKKGWSYQGIGLGTPFVSAKNTTRQGFPNDSRDYFNNNRVAVWHLGGEIMAYGWNVQGKVSYSNNFGTYGTSPIGHSRGHLHRPNSGVFPASKQLSGFLNLGKTLPTGLELAGSVAMDYGALLYHSAGLAFSIRQHLK